MQTEILPIDSRQPDLQIIARAADALLRGDLVAFPTETVYGLGANALDAAAVARIFAAKGRPPNNPLIVHALDLDAARTLAAHWPAAADRLAERFWPGPLTLVVPRASHVPTAVAAGGPTVAIRVPSHPVALALLRAAAVPIAAPSANRSNYISPTTAAHVAADLSGRAAIILDGGPAANGIESTVLDLSGASLRILRPGPVSRQTIEALLGEPVMVQAAASDSGALPSPGMLARHYSPRARLVLARPETAEERVAELRSRGETVGRLVLGERRSGEQADAEIALPVEPAAYAAGLYAALHELDDAGVAWIVADVPPEDERWTAIRDRLTRASE